MPRKRANHITVVSVQIDFLWPQEKYEIIKEMARRNHLTIDDMVDTILDDWAALAGKEAGILDWERSLYFPQPEAPEKQDA